MVHFQPRTQEKYSSTRHRVWYVLTVVYNIVHLVNQSCLVFFKLLYKAFKLGLSLVSGFGSVCSQGSNIDFFHFFLCVGCLHFWFFKPFQLFLGLKYIVPVTSLAKYFTATIFFIATEKFAWIYIQDFMFYSIINWSVEFIITVIDQIRKLLSICLVASACFMRYD